MIKRTGLAMIALVLFACIPHAFAMSEGSFVTKETQARMGLNYTLTAVRVSNTAVLVHMEIPVQGKLKTLKRVTMDIQTLTPGVASSPELSADLQTTQGKEGSMVVSFQVSPTLADKCTIRLVATSPTAFLSNEVFYAVELKGYVTVRK